MKRIIRTSGAPGAIGPYSQAVEAFARYYTGDFPARAAYAVKDLPLNVLIEIETIAVK